MKPLLTFTLACLCLAIVAGEEDPPTPPEIEPPPLTEEQIEEAERIADEIMREGKPVLKLTEEERATYEKHLADARLELIKCKEALDQRDRMAAGEHYVKARLAFTKIPKEASLPLAPNYWTVARALVAFAKVVLGSEDNPPEVLLPPKKQEPPAEEPPAEDPSSEPPPKEPPAETPKEQSPAKPE